MDQTHLLLIFIVVIAIVFDFTNGFHDTANSIATMVGTRAMPPQAAVLMASLLNFAGAFFSLKVAATVGKGIIDKEFATLEVVLAGLVGAICWNVATWYVGLPSSSSHALFGGLMGAAIASHGLAAVLWSGVGHKIIVPALASPIIGFALAIILMAILMNVFKNANPAKANRSFRTAQIASGCWLSFTHGMNDAQKTMGIISLALLTAAGNPGSAKFVVPTWVIFSAASAMALGTYAGGWRIIKTLGSKVVKMQPVQGFAASMSAASVLFVAAHQGFPVSTTHAVSGSVMGAGASKRLSSVRWGLAGEIMMAWALTLPCAALVGAVAYGLVVISPLVLLAVAAGAGYFVLVQTRRRPAPIIETPMLPPTAL